MQPSQEHASSDDLKPKKDDADSLSENSSVSTPSSQNGPTIISPTTGTDHAVSTSPTADQPQAEAPSDSLASNTTADVSASQPPQPDIDNGHVASSNSSVPQQDLTSTNSQTFPLSTPTESTPFNSAESAVPSGAGVVNGVPVASAKAKGTKSKWLLPIITLIVLVIAGGTYAVAFYLPNQPGNVFKKSLSNTATGYDHLVSYIKQEQGKNYQGSKLTGTFSVNAGAVNVDGSLTGQSYKNNSTGTVNVDIAGQKAVLNVRSIVADGQKAPDIYMQATGIKSTLDDFGLSSYDSLDGQWIAIDHTILSGLSNASTASGLTSLPTKNQINDALMQISQVNRNYLLSTDSNKAVLVNKKYLGKSTQEGRDTYGYQVGVNNAHLKAYAGAVLAALDKSTLNNWVKSVTGKNVSEEVKLPTSFSVPANYTFNLYVDAKTKLPHKIHFADSSDVSNYLDFGLSYTGGSSYPFFIKAGGGNGDSTGSMTLSVILNTSSNSVNASLDVNDKNNGTPETLQASLSMSPSNAPLTVTAPADAKSFLDIMTSLGLNTAALNSTATDDSALNSLFTTM